jgi:hypothetical protein
MRLLKTNLQQGRRARRPEAYFTMYVEGLSNRERSWSLFSAADQKYQARPPIKNLGLPGTK